VEFGLNIVLSLIKDIQQPSTLGYLQLKLNVILHPLILSIFQKILCALNFGQDFHIDSASDLRKHYTDRFVFMSATRYTTFYFAGFSFRVLTDSTKWLIRSMQSTIRRIDGVLNVTFNTPSSLTVIKRNSVFAVTSHESLGFRTASPESLGFRTVGG
jgi:hypothetical protein